jgi:hypothetical protein
LYDPFGVLEAKVLSSSLPEPSPQVDPTRELRERTLDVFSLPEESLVAFAHGYSAAVVVSSLDEFLTTSIDASRASFASPTLTSAAFVMAGFGTDGLADLEYTLQGYSTTQL